MTLQSRQVLADCRVALELLEEETGEQRWRVHWAAAVALIRAVGHVLDKVDGRDPAIKSLAGAAYKRWMSDVEEHRVFRDFIDHERNNLLKEYRSDVHPLDRVQFALQYTGVPADGGEPEVIHELAELDENIYRPMLDGPWEGDDARDVMESAIEWWEAELDAIDLRLDQRSKEAK